MMKISEELKGYEFLCLLGQGGFGKTYLVSKLDTKVNLLFNIL